MVSISVPQFLQWTGSSEPRNKSEPRIAGNHVSIATLMNLMRAAYAKGCEDGKKRYHCWRGFVIYT
jgi:hypothetical protein